MPKRAEQQLTVAQFVALRREILTAYEKEERRLIQRLTSSLERLGRALTKAHRTKSRKKNRVQRSRHNRPSPNQEGKGMRGA
jgi:hypothetical protein